MEEEQAPPIIAAPAAVNSAPSVARWRWWIHLLILTALPIAVGIMGISSGSRTTAMLPAKVSGLLLATAENLAYFAVIFAIAWLASRVNRQQLLMQWRGGLMPVVWGAAYSIALRILIMVIATTVVVLWLLIKTMAQQGQGQPQDLKQSAFRPQVEHLVNLDALTDNPVYFVLMLTLVSFVLAGLREELWRAAMLAGINALFPRLAGRWSGQAVAVMIVAVLFGVAHTPQGWAGMAVTTFLGVGLGAIMVWHKSIWEAVLAHGFFDAATFVFLYVAGKYFPHQLPGF